ncbi:YdcF family protein [Desulfovibrio inopinatus]|uniref:YdcF family protein n=1 Tax=Desulfovibrio inopinatus TaxID=102109 RepID=UPI00041EBDAA|nr:YdcF family protein [Desulfovibrio inopinatus]
MPISAQDRDFARILFDYHRLDCSLAPADCLIVMGSHDLRVADRGAALLSAHMAPFAVISGGFGKLTQTQFHTTEARLFANRILEHGIEPQRLFLEEHSTNTGENVCFSMALLKERGIQPNSVILVQKPYLERRAFASFRYHFPDVTVMTTSPQLDFNDYIDTGAISVEDVVHLLVGDTERVMAYPDLGFQIPQYMPDKVRNAYLHLRTRFAQYRLRHDPLSKS